MSWSSFILGSSVFDLTSSILYMLASLSAVIPLTHHWYHEVKRHALDLTKAQYKAYRKKQKNAGKRAKASGR